MCEERYMDYLIHLKSASSEECSNYPHFAGKGTETEEI